MVSSTPPKLSAEMSEIQVYARLRPLPARAYKYESISINSDTINVSVGDKRMEKFTSSHYNEHSFRFKRVFDENATQQDVFDVVAVEMIDRFLEGFNGTLFAYGQTASGKTYTIEGSARLFDDRGLIPRAISYIYSALQSCNSGSAKEKDDVTIHISYLEIYQDTGYDLLNPGNRNEGMVLNLPKVSVLEGQNGEVFIRHLSSHLAGNEEVALSLLFQGSTCRRVAETTMNFSSSRSHTIFTLTLTSQKHGSQVRTRSKLNLVDLAGSERVYKTCATGQILQEAKHINLSLHYLEHVIVILQKRSTSRSQSVTPSSSVERANNNRQQSCGFVPYRNCLLTMVLRDSLGGNCITAMIANLSVDKVNLLETISTCRFAQRVACISNKARRNEELDDKVVIRRLKERIAQLQYEIKTMRKDCTIEQPKSGDNSPSKVTDEQKKTCHRVLYDFLHGRLTDPIAEGINSPSLFLESLSIMKDVIMHTLKESKKYKQNQRIDQQLTIIETPSNNPKPIAYCVTSPPSLSTSTSPQSQISSGFVSMKDECIQDTSCVETYQPKSKKKSKTRSLSPPWHSRSNNHSILVVTDDTDKMTCHDKTASSKAEVKGQQLPMADKKLEDNLTRKTDTDITSCCVENKRLTETSVSRVHRERQDLMRKMKTLNSEMKDSNARSNFKQNGTELEDICKQKHVEQHLKQKMNRLLERHAQQHAKTISQMPIVNMQTKSQVDVTIDTREQQKEDDIKLAKLQKQLELKEAATRKRLYALKMELQNESVHHEQVTPGTTQYNAQDYAEKAGYQTSMNPALRSTDTMMELTKTFQNREKKFVPKTAVIIEKQKSSEKDMKILLKSPQQSPEKVYLSALDKHKARVSQIRQCIKSAIIIQRSWRRYKQKQTFILK